MEPVAHDTVTIANNHKDSIHALVRTYIRVSFCVCSISYVGLNMHKYISYPLVHLEQTQRMHKFAFKHEIRLQADTK
jgi:hypothetical protein